MRAKALLLVIAVLVTSCGGGTVGAAEYAATVQDMVWGMNQGLDDLQAEHDASPITAESEREYWSNRAALRDDFYEGMRAVTPPPEYADMHDAALAVIDRLVTAEHGVVEAAEGADDLSDLIALREGEAMAALSAADEEAIALCRSAQEVLDTSSDERLEPGIPWITPAVGEVVQVVFGCTAEERGG